MGQVEKILKLIEQLKEEVQLLDVDRANLEEQNKELLAALSEFTSCLQINCKNRKKRKK